jgi:hypothetical protein
MMQAFTTLTIAVNQETLAWLEDQARKLTEAQEHQQPLSVADAAVLMLERQRRAQTDHETNPLE